MNCVQEENVERTAPYDIDETEETIYEKLEETAFPCKIKRNLLVEKNLIKGGSSTNYVKDLEESRKSEIK